MKKIISLVVSFAPAMAFAQTQPITDVNSLSTKLVGIGNLVIYLLISLAVIFIIYNVVMYVVKGSDPSAKSAAVANIGWGILGLAIILSIWGIVNVLINTFKTTTPAQTIPQIENNGSLPPKVF